MHMQIHQCAVVGRHPSAQRRYPISGAVHAGCECWSNSRSSWSLSCPSDVSRLLAPSGVYRTTRCSRWGPTPRVNTNPNSSFTYCVTLPLTATSHCSPSTSMIRRGMLDRTLRKILQPGFDVGHEAIGIGTIHDAVIEREREQSFGPDGDHIGAVHGDDRGLFFDAADAQNGSLRLIDDGGADRRAEYAGVGDGERPFLDLIRNQLPGPGPLS